MMPRRVQEIQGNFSVDVVFWISWEFVNLTSPRQSNIALSRSQTQNRDSAMAIVCFEFGVAEIR